MTEYLLSSADGVSHMRDEMFRQNGGNYGDSWIPLIVVVVIFTGFAWYHLVAEETRRKQSWLDMEAERLRREDRSPPKDAEADSMEEQKRVRRQEREALREKRRKSREKREARDYANQRVLVEFAEKHIETMKTESPIPAEQIAAFEEYVTKFRAAEAERSRAN